jgi:peroxiredoxin
MEGMTQQPPPLSGVSPRGGLAVTSLVLGILAACFSFLLVGIVLGLIGLVLGVVHLRRSRPSKAMAWWGVGLSVFGLAASVGFGAFYFYAYKRIETVTQAPDEDLAAWEGVAAPDFTFVSLDGKKAALSEFRGKRVVLDFWATWCGPCQKEMPHFIRLVNDASSNELVVVGISSEDEATLRPFVQRKGITYPVASASKLPEPYGSVRAIPTTFFIDRQGVIQNVLVGYHDFAALRSHALQKDFEGSPKARPAARGSVQPLLEAALGNEQARSSYQERLLAFHKRTLTEAYQQVGMRDPRWDDRVIRYLDDFAEVFTDPSKARTGEDLLAAGKEIAGLGCNDPLFLYCYSVAQESGDDPAGAEKSLTAAAEGLLKSKYPAVLQRFAATRMAYWVRNQGFKRQGEYETWRNRAITLMTASLQDGSYRDGEQRIFIMHFEPDWKDLFLDRREEVYQAIKAVKGIDPWILKIVEGEYWLARAWQARGRGWADTVTDEGWKGFYDSLAKARANLASAWKMRPDYPEAAAKMIRVTMGEGGRQRETPRDWFGRAIRAQADYLPAYDYYAHQLWPRWGGSHEAMLAFGAECLATKRFDTGIPYQYYVVLGEVLNDMDSPGTALWDDPVVFSNLQIMCEGYIRSDNPPHRKSAYQTLYAAICWRTGRYEMARRILDELGDKAEGYIFLRDFRVPFDTARQEIYAMTSPWAGSLQTASTLAATQAIEAYQELLARADADSNVLAYAAQKLEAIRMAMKREQGEWVTLSIPKDLAGWSVRAGVWKVEDDGAVVGESTKGGLLLVCDHRFDPDLEVRGELQFLQAPYLYKFNGAVAVGANDRKPNDLYTCLLYRAEREAVAGPGFRSSDRITKPANVDTQNSFLMRIQGGHLTLIVNDAPVFQNEHMIRYDTDCQQRLAIGGYYWYPGATVRFKNLQVRSLKALVQAENASKP